MIDITSHRRARSARAFTIVELLVVVAIIVALLGTLLVALSKATQSAARTNTQFFLSSLSNGLASFRTDIGYLPPVLGRRDIAPTVGNARDLFIQPAWAVSAATGQPTAASVDDLQIWYSYTSLPEYLLGYGSREQDGYGAYGPSPYAPAGSPGSQEIPLNGFRSPGRDGVWGALLDPRITPGNGKLIARNAVPYGLIPTAASVNGPVLNGKVYGPYIEVKDQSTIGGIKGFDANGEPIIVRPGDDPLFDTYPKVFLDYWGNPIQYYRRPYAAADLTGPDPIPGTLAGVTPVLRNLGDIFVLRPWSFRPGEDLVGVADAAIPSDNATLGRLKSADFAIFSRGPDKAWDRTMRRDPNEFNHDNLTEVGK